MIISPRTAAGRKDRELTFLRGPLANEFPAYPATWYLFGRESDLQRGPVSKNLLGRRLVSFRTSSGRVAVMNARCAHQGADLGRGRVVGETLQCPFHHWCFATDGRCTQIPNLSEIPEFACQTVYPVVVRHGYVFFFNGPQPLFSLPLFAGEAADNFAAGEVFSFVEDGPWPMIVANGFDTEHFRSVHDRSMVGTEQVDNPTAFSRRIQLEAEIMGNSIYDRLMRQWIGRRAQISITSWGGPLLEVTARFRRTRSFILILVQPLPKEQTRVEVIVYARRQRLVVLERANLWVRRWFTRGFLRNDTDKLTSLRYNPHTFTKNERVIVEFYHWLARLPQTSPGKNDLPS